MTHLNLIIDKGIGEGEGVMSLEYSANDLFSKIGRNVILFQHLENLLKYILANSQISGYASELQEIQVKNASTISKQTMGNLVAKFIETIGPALPEAVNASENIKESHFSFRFRIGMDASNVKEQKESLAKLVSERNELIHHFSANLSRTSSSCYLDLEKRLDLQAEKIKRKIQDLKSIVTALNDGKKALLDLVTSEQYKKEFELAWLRDSLLVLLLADIALREARTDGWTSLSVAGQLVKLHAPEEVMMLQERYGHKSLKSLIIAAEIFDIQEEITQKGGVRVLYRLKPAWQLLPVGES